LSNKFQIRPYAVAPFRRARPVAGTTRGLVDARLARQRILNAPERRFGWVIIEAALWWRAAEWQRGPGQQAALDPAASRALLEGLAIRFATR
jgi:hypothetical protein